MKHIVAALMALTFLSACGALTPRPQMLKRFTYYRYVTQTPADTPLVSLTTFSTRVPSGDPPRGLMNMAERAQAELVRALAAKTEGAPALARALALPFAPEQESPSLIDRSRVKRRVVFSLENRSGGPADRVSLIRVALKLTGGGKDTATFLGWNRMESEYRMIDLGKLTSTQTRTASADLSLSIPVMSAAPKLSTGAENQLNEEVALQRRVPSLHGTLAPREATLMEQGVAGIDLTGNIYADIEILLPFDDAQAYSFTYATKGGAPDCAQRPSLRSHTIRHPRNPGPLTGDVRLEYVVRRVERGEHTDVEADDWVTFVDGVRSAPAVTLIPAEELAVSVFTLRSAGKDLRVDDALSGGGLRIRDLRLASYEDAFRMLNWLHRCNAALPGYPLLVNGATLTGGGVRHLLIHNFPLGSNPQQGAAAHARAQD